MTESKKYKLWKNDGFVKKNNEKKYKSKFQPKTTGTFSQHQISQILMNDPASRMCNVTRTKRTAHPRCAFAWSTFPRVICTFFISFYRRKDAIHQHTAMNRRDKLRICTLKIYCISYDFISAIDILYPHRFTMFYGHSLVLCGTHEFQVHGT